MSIIIHLQGGLGNQLFQYATAKSISDHYQLKLLLDDSWFYQDFVNITPRSFLLHDLKVSEMRVTQRNLLFKNRFLNKINLMMPRLHEIIIHQSQPFAFDDSLFYREMSPTKDHYLIGYLQSFRYFQNIRNSLQDIFQPKSSISPHYASYLNSINESDAVMLHIRRSDYVSLKTAKDHHGALGITYYINCMGKMLERHPASHFFIFSDDLKWARNHLPQNYQMTFIETEDRETSVVDELYLMSKCRHHIIANSSLSWWGAWLSENHSNQTILAPERWLNKANVNLDNLLPEAWERIPE
jgi:hypothetical protein